MSAHSRLAPSSADRWVECPASVALSEQFPELLENPAAPEGVAAHWVVSSMLTTHVPIEGDITPNGIAVTREMIDGALLFYNHVFKLANPYGGIKGRFEWETTVTMPSIHPDMWGTYDGAGMLDTLDLTGDMHIIDYKFGHLEVDPLSMQLVSYARGKLDSCNFNGHDEQFIRVHLHIVQPRCYAAAGPIRTYSTTAADLRGHWNQLRAAADEALKPNPRYKISNQCKYCPGRRACPELKRFGGYIQDYAEYQQPIELPVQDLGLELDFIEKSIVLLEARATGLREQTEANIRAGNHVPGWVMGNGRSVKSWSAPVDEIFALGDMLGVELRKVSPPTPKQAAEMLRKKGIDESVIDAYSNTHPGSLKLVPATETLAAKAFGVK